MKLTVIAVLLFTGTQTLAQSDDAGPCTDQHGEHVEQEETRSPDPAQNVDGYGQIVGERGETNSGTETDDGAAYTGDPAFGDCDGR
ncbi:conotoxin [uncultured Tateyamaria sp.]|uniref:conotoxin n=1 Tax=uncultured Tateyamaria sp. TaxID=455651 RepID=UPI00262EF046|nr:conotoxin [uncultured Tateyamaria sp.]